MRPTGEELERAGVEMEAHLDWIKRKGHIVTDSGATTSGFAQDPTDMSFLDATWPAELQAWFTVGLPYRVENWRLLNRPDFNVLWPETGEVDYYDRPPGGAPPNDGSYPSAGFCIAGHWLNKFVYVDTVGPRSGWVFLWDVATTGTPESSGPAATSISQFLRAIRELDDQGYANLQGEIDPLLPENFLTTPTRFPPYDTPAGLFGVHSRTIGDYVLSLTESGEASPEEAGLPDPKLSITDLLPWFDLPTLLNGDHINTRTAPWADPQ